MGRRSPAAPSAASCSAVDPSCGARPVVGARREQLHLHDICHRGGPDAARPHNPYMFDPARGYPNVVPYLRYADPALAVRWLTDVLGAREALRLTLPDGRIGHVELLLGRAVVSVGLLAEGAPNTPLPTRHTLQSMTLVFVEDVDAAAQRAVSKGGHLIDPATNQPWGLRQAIVADPGHHLWELTQHLREVPPSAWGAELISDLPGAV